MLKLLHLHWVVNRRMLWQLSPLWTLWMYVGFARSREAIDSAVVVPFLTLAFAGTWMAIVALQGLTQGTEPFLLALPVRRSKVVSAAFVAPLIASLAGFALALLPAVMYRIRLDGDIWGASLVCLSALAFGLFLFLPLRFRLGGPKAILVLAILLILGVATLAFGWGITESVQRFAQALAERMEHPAPFAAALLAGLAILGTASHTYSRHAYARRSF